MVVNSPTIKKEYMSRILQIIFKLGYTAPDLDLEQYIPIESENIKIKPKTKKSKLIVKYIFFNSSPNWAFISAWR